MASSDAYTPQTPDSYVSPLDSNAGFTFVSCTEIYPDNSLLNESDENPNEEENS